MYTFEEGDGIEPFASIHKTDLPNQYLTETISICRKSNGDLDKGINGGEFLFI